MSDPSKAFEHLLLHVRYVPEKIGSHCTNFCRIEWEFQFCQKSQEQNVFQLRDNEQNVTII